MWNIILKLVEKTLYKYIILCATSDIYNLVRIGEKEYNILLWNRLFSSSPYLYTYT